MKTCGQCEHTQLIPNAPPTENVRLCFGAPPTVCLVPTQRLKSKSEMMANPTQPPVEMSLQPQFHRPIVRTSERACALFTPREIPDDSNQSTASPLAVA